MRDTSWSGRIVSTLENRSGLVIALGLVVTLLLVAPMVLMAPDEEASSDPAGEVFDLQDEVNERFQSPYHAASFIVEARDGDILTQAPLWDLYQNSQRLLVADASGELTPEDLPQQPYLYTLFDPDTNRKVVGIVSSIADAVQRTMEDDPGLNTSLENATEDQVKIAVYRVLSNPETEGLTDALSVAAVSEKRMVAGQEIDYWTAPAALFTVLADNERLGGGTHTIGLAGDDTVVNKEEFNRNVQKVLRGDENSYRLWGIAIDVNLESADEGQIAGMFIMFTVIAAVLIVWVSLRSYWAMALTGVGLGALMIWLKGVSALVGIKSGMVVDMIVPIAMISLGVDFVVHAVRRYQEERGLGYPPRRALAVGLAGVLGALVLAMFSDGIAFLSNASSGIEAVMHFGIAAAIAVLASFVVLGVMVPLALMRVDHMVGPGAKSTSLVMRFLRFINGVGAAVLFGTAIIFLVAVSKPLGLVLLVGTTVVFVVLPLLVRRWRTGGHAAWEDDGIVEPDSTGERSLTTTAVVEAVVVGLARFAPAVLLIIATVTGLSVWLALKLEPTFDVKDFFHHDSDFVVSLDKLDEHIGDRGGEGGIIYIKGDLTDPQSLVVLQDFVEGLPEIPEIARDSKGELWTFDNILSLIRDVTGNQYALNAVERASGIDIVDSDGDGIPDSREQVKAIYDFIWQYGLPLDAENLLFNPLQVREMLFHDPVGAEENVAILMVGIVGSREQANVTAAREALQARLDDIEDGPTITLAGLTGSPFTRDAQLSATTETLQRSVPIAAVGAFILLLIAMRSLRYAVVTVIPIGLVVAWLYGLMYVSGYALNFVTATVGAVSIGVGIDYSIHMTERFREELGRSGSKSQALRRAARGTGVALLASAASSIVGFSIMGFAPMPLFASYGQLTAIMIALALAASLVVLPSLLLLVTPGKAPVDEPAPFPASAE